MLIKSLLTDQFFIVVTPMNSIRFLKKNYWCLSRLAIPYLTSDWTCSLFHMFDVVTERLLSTRMDLIANVCGGSAAPRLVVRIRHCVDPLGGGNPKDQHGAVHSGGVVVVL